MPRMADSTRELLERALKLPPNERVKLAHDLLQSVDDAEADLSPEWIEEIERRVERVLAGTGGHDEDWRIVLDRIRNRRPSQIP